MMLDSFGRSGSMTIVTLQSAMRWQSSFALAELAAEFRILLDALLGVGTVLLLLREQVARHVTRAAGAEHDRLDAQDVGTAAHRLGVVERLGPGGVRAGQAELARQEAIAGPERQRGAQNLVATLGPLGLGLLRHHGVGRAPLEEIISYFLHERRIRRPTTGSKEDAPLLVRARAACGATFSPDGSRHRSSGRHSKKTTTIHSVHCSFTPDGGCLIVHIKPKIRPVDKP